jgi:short subunit fatty acids transporter
MALIGWGLGLVIGFVVWKLIGGTVGFIIGVVTVVIASAVINGLVVAIMSVSKKGGSANSARPNASRGEPDAQKNSMKV